VVYWLFFAVGFTEEGLVALHDLISTGNPDFKDPVFWYNYIIAPVNTITISVTKMLPSCVAMHMRSPVNRKAHQLWRFKMALSYIKIIVNYGNPDNLDTRHMNPSKQPYLHAMVICKKFGRKRYEQINRDDKNTWVDGLMRAFLISFPEKFKDWSEQTIWLKERSLGPNHQLSVNASNTPCDVLLNPSAVWKSYLGKGVFERKADYDIPTSWDAYEVFKLMNEGAPGTANFSTAALKKISEWNERAKAPRTPMSKKRKKKGESDASDTNLEGVSPSALDLPLEPEKAAGPKDYSEALGSTTRQKKTADKARREFCPVFYHTSRKHFQRGQLTLATAPEEIRFKIQAFQWFRSYCQLTADEVTNFLAAAGDRPSLHRTEEQRAQQEEMQGAMSRYYRVVEAQLSEVAPITLLGDEENNDDGYYRAGCVVHSTADHSDDSLSEQQENSGDDELKPAAKKSRKSPSKNSGSPDPAAKESRESPSTKGGSPSSGAKEARRSPPRKGGSPNPYNTRQNKGTEIIPI